MFCVWAAVAMAIRHCCIHWNITEVMQDQTDYWLQKLRTRHTCGAVSRTSGAKHLQPTSPGSIQHFVVSRTSYAKLIGGVSRKNAETAAPDILLNFDNAQGPLLRGIATCGTSYSSSPSKLRLHKSRYHCSFQSRSQQKQNHCWRIVHKLRHFGCLSG